MLWAIDAELSDGYDLCQGKDEFWQQSFSAADWNVVAGHLTTRLQKSTKKANDLIEWFNTNQL